MATSPVQANGISAVEHEVGVRLDRVPFGPWHRRVVALVGVGTFFNFFEVALGSLLVPLLPSGWVETTLDKSLIIGAAFAGELLGAIFLAPLADRFGRRTMFQVNLIAYAALSLISVFAPDLTTLVVLRVLVGIGLGAELVLVDTFLAEVVPGAVRGRMLGVCYAVGMLAVPACGLLAVFLPHQLGGISSWQLMLVISALGAAIVWVLRRALPESPRWLAARGRPEDALAAVRHIEATSGRPVEPVTPPAPTPPVAEHATELRLLRPPLRRRTLLACVIWFCQTIGFYGFSTIAPLVLIAKGFDVVESLGYSAITAFGYPVGALVMTVLAERFQRRNLLIVSAVLVAVFGIVFGIATATWLILVAGSALNISNVVMGNVSHAYSAELFPTAVRTTAAGRTYSLSRLIAAVLPFVTLSVLYAFGAGVLFGACAVLIVAMAVTVAFIGPRTNSLRLETI